MDELRFKVGLICVAIMLAFCAFFMYMQHSAIQSAIESSREETTAPTPEKINQARAANAKDWDAAIKAMKSHNHQEAAVAYGRAANALYSTSVAGDEGFRKEFKKREKEFAAEVVREFDAVTKQAVANPAESFRFSEFFNRFMDAAPDLRQRYDSRTSEVVGARVRAAGTWFRLAVAGEDREYTAPLVEALTRQFNPGYNRTLVQGEVLDERETAATWMTLTVKAVVEGASYKVRQSGYERILSMTVPETIVITLSLQKRQPIPTSWDSLPTIRLHHPPPEIIRATEGDIYDRVSEVANTQKGLFVQDIIEQARKLVRFELFPGRDLGKVGLVAGGKIDPEGARILACVDPERLARESQALIGTGAGAQISRDLVLVAIEQDLEPLGPWVVQTLASADADLRDKAITALGINPAFGGFGPVLLLLQQAPTDEAKLPLFRVLGKWLFDDRVQEAFLRSILKKSAPRRELAAIFLAGIPSEKLPAYLSWMKDADAEFSRTVYEAIIHRSPQLKDDLFGPLFENAPAQTQYRMLEDFHFVAGRHGKPVIEALKKAACQTSEAHLRRKAIEILMYEASSTPEGWQALSEISRTVTDPELAPRIKQALTTAVSHANPEAAQAYQLAAMSGGNKEDRKAAAHKFFRAKEGIDDKLRLALPLIDRFGREPGFFEALLRGFSEQGSNYIKDTSQIELEQMITRAMGHPEKMVRYFGYSMAHRIWSKGQKKFADLLRSALVRETDSWARGQGQNLLTAIDESGKPAEPEE